MRKNSNIIDIHDLYIDHNIFHKSYESFFKFHGDCSTSKLHVLLSQQFPIEDRARNIKIEYTGYGVDKNVYHELVYSSRYLSYTARLRINFVVKIDNHEIKYTLNVNHVPIDIRGSYFMINGTRKIMIYQLSRIGGIYYDLNSAGNKIVNVRMVSTSGSRIELKLNQRDIINIYVNSSKKIMIHEFFALIDDDKLERYLRYYKSGASITFFKKFSHNSLRYALLFGSLFHVSIIDGIMHIYCEDGDEGKYIFDKFSGCQYDKENKCVSVEISKLYHCFICTDNVINLVVRKGNDLCIKDITLIDDQVKKKLISANFEICRSKNLKVLFFKRKHEFICRSFVNIMDKGEQGDSDDDVDMSRANDTTDATEFGEYDDDDSDILIDKSDAIYDAIDEESTLSVEYAIDHVIRNKLNRILSIKYSVNSERITEEDIIKLFCYLSEYNFSDNIVKQSYDFLSYKRIKRPEDFIAGIILRKINKLKSNIRYLSIDKDLKTNIDDFLNSYSISNEIRKIFSSHPLVQFLDQTNPLSEISHRRRLSVFNLINVEKYQVSFEGRDINSSYYGRICPIQTPEGSNIGLINSLTINAQIDDYGLIVSPYRIMNSGKITNKIIFLNADEDKDTIISDYSSCSESKGTVLARKGEDIFEIDIKKVQYCDLDNKSMFSIAACLIPHINHNDARRALMGSNMQRQATPNVNPCAPIVGTGVEKITAHIACDNNNIAEFDGVVYYACANFVIVYSEDEIGKIQVCEASKYNKTNMKTCNNAVTKVYNGQRVKKGDILIDLCSRDNGELALGNNVLVGFLSWYGYNFEDSIVISNRLIRDGFFENINIVEVDIKAKEIEIDLVEKITLDNPNEEVKNLPHLDKRGIIKIGTKVKPNKVLVSRVMPVEGDMSVEDNVLSVIFGKEISEYKDISYKSNYDLRGIVVDVKHFHRHKDASDEFNHSIKLMKITIIRKLCAILLDKAVSAKVITIEKRTVYIQMISDTHDESKICNIISEFLKHISDDDFICKTKEYVDYIYKQCQYLTDIMNVSKNCNIDNNVFEYVNVLIAERRSLCVGDKIAGRHGNKGVVSIVCPMEDMPFMDDGTILDMLLNPIGIPNRLNIGQVIESYMGLTSYELSRKVKMLIRTSNTTEARMLITNYLKYKLHRHDLTVDDVMEIINSDKYVMLKAPMFSSIGFDEIKEVLRVIDSNLDGTYRLRCGITGEYLNRKVHVGLKYMLKLNHMAIDKLSARETGGYSAILQQPLPRKANYGGQRFGEMEAWAVEAYGLSQVLRETLGPKSDDREARNKMYSDILDRKYRFVSHLCETVNVIIRYLNGACIKLEFIRIVVKMSN